MTIGKHNIAGLAAILSMLMGASLANPASTSASETTSMINLEEVFRQQFAYAWPEFRLVTVSTEAIQAANTNAKLIGSPDLTRGNPYYFGTSTLKNTTSSTQIANAQSFSKSLAWSTTTQVTRGISVANQIMIQIGSETIGLKAAATTTLTLSLTDSTAKTSTETVTYASPQQSVSIPPNTTATVRATLYDVTANGKIKLSTDLSGKVGTRIESTNGNVNQSTPFDLYTVFSKAQQKGAPRLPEGLTLNADKKVVHFDGVANFESNYGSEFVMEMSYESNKRNSPAGRSAKVTVPAVTATTKAVAADDGQLR
ncbi:ETX/MTX2 family pore-forming toxin [Streptomyces sp. NPDC127084]|uniref:ETX/MTX2 family pore-forming toxin n=1 Tax=Streptomyces sp. NPDC127084 TaxID=3347133 RepID=UPI0036501447